MKDKMNLKIYMKKSNHIEIKEDGNGIEQLKAEEDNGRNLIENEDLEPYNLMGEGNKKA